MSSGSWGDDAMWRQAVAGDRKAFSALVELLQPRIRRLLYRLQGFRGEVDDQTQEVFLRLMAALPSIRDLTRAGGFVCSIAANVSREESRRRRGVETVIEPADPALEPDRKVQQGETAEQVRRAIRALPETLRETLVLATYEGLSPTQIGEVLKVDAGAIRHRLFRARSQLKAALQSTLFQEVSR